MGADSAVHKSPTTYRVDFGSRSDLADSEHRLMSNEVSTDWSRGRRQESMVVCTAREDAVRNRISNEPAITETLSR